MLTHSICGGLSLCAPSLPLNNQSVLVGRRATEAAHSRRHGGGTEDTTGVILGEAETSQSARHREPDTGTRVTSPYRLGLVAQAKLEARVGEGGWAAAGAPPHNTALHGKNAGATDTRRRGLLGGPGFQ